ncbi:MAG: DedA family protein [Bryobacteraceae bacterium]|jgi:membrane protein DedA with SNARE-associated domain
MEHHILEWITEYGYAAIIGLLMLGIVGLPVPDETLLTFTGYLVFRGNLRLPLAFAAALTGSGCGITISYLIGRTFGLKAIHRYGRYVRIREEHVEKAHAWFRRAGHWSLTLGYFMPGVRHLTAFAAGMSALEAPQFALFAYTGAVLWVSAFLSLGYFLGDRWEAVEHNIHHYLVYLTLVGIIALAGYLIWRKRRARAR